MRAHAHIHTRIQHTHTHTRSEICDLSAAVIRNKHEFILTKPYLILFIELEIVITYIYIYIYKHILQMRKYLRVLLWFMVELLL
jgi:hypothetical protein